MPTFQPKHRPFLGLVYFVSRNPELLPWTTTKTGINQENGAWRSAIKKMASVGRQITNTLDRRYKNTGTDISLDDLRKISGKSVIAASQIVAKTSVFDPPKQTSSTSVTIQYTVDVASVEKIRRFLDDSKKSPDDIGLLTFNYYSTKVVRA